MASLIVCIALFVLAVQVSSTKWSECGSTTGEVTSVQVSDCPDSVDTCILQRGTQMNISIVFQSKTTSNTVTAVVHGVIDGVPLPFSLPIPDGCKTGVTCPMQNGKSYTYTNNLNIKKSYPPLAVTVRWELKDDTKSDIVCVEVSCKIQ